MLVARSLVLAFGLAVVAAPVVASCTPQGQCEFTQPGIAYCDTAASCNGRFITPKVWESNPIRSNWITFPPYRDMTMTITDKAGNKLPGKVFRINAWIATAPDGIDSVEAAGNLAVFTTCPNDAPCIVIKNETCVTNYLRVIVESE